jgi:hypothetical protein
MKTEPSTDPSSQPRLALVYPNLQGTSVVLVVIRIAHLLGVLQVPLSSSAGGVATTMMEGTSPLGFRGAEPPSKRARHWSFLPVSSWYAHGVVNWLTSLPLLLLMF